MDTSIYSSSELRYFQEIMEAGLDEVRDQRLDCPLAVMARRLFEAAQNGERDREKLKHAALNAEIIQLRAYERSYGMSRKSC